MEHDDQFLPKELVTEILLRLPARSLVRFKIVCKSWFSTVNSPCFIERHVLNGNDNPTNLVVVSIPAICSKKIIHCLSYDTLGAAQTIRYNWTDIDIASSCNGLILFSTCFTTKWFLWNPTTGQTKLLPSPSSSFSSQDLGQSYIHSPYQNVGFGFDTKTMDYKVVVIDDGTVKVKIYSLKTNSWTRIATTFTNKVSQIQHSWYGWHGAFSNGMLSWKAMYKEDMNVHHTNVILSVDLSSETIITTPMPSSITHIYYPTPELNNYCLVYKESLALVHWYANPHERSFDIWVLGEYGAKESWKKLFTIGPLQGIERLWGFWKDGKVFVETFHKDNSINETELLLLDTLSPTQQTTSLQISSFQNCFYGAYNMKVFTFRESLVPLKS